MWHCKEKRTKEGRGKKMESEGEDRHFSVFEKMKIAVYHEEKWKYDKKKRVAREEKKKEMWLEEMGLEEASVDCPVWKHPFSSRGKSTSIQEAVRHLPTGPALSHMEESF